MSGNGYIGCKLIGCWACAGLGSLHVPGFEVEVTVPTRLTGSNEYDRSAGPVLPSGHAQPVDTPCRSAVQGPPATLLIAPTHPVEVDTVPPHVRSALHCVVMVHLFVVGPLTKMYSPSRRSSARAGLASPTAEQVTARATAIARVIAMILPMSRPARGLSSITCFGRRHRRTFNIPAQPRPATMSPRLKVTGRSSCS